MKRNHMIDFIRLLFCVVLVIFHSHSLNNQESFFGRGQLCVEFFFLVSGYLMAVSINKESSDDNLKFIFRKIKSVLYPFLSCWAISFILINIAKYENVTQLLLNFLNSAFEILFVHSAGFEGYNSIPQTWYLSSMFISMFIIYPIYKRNKKNYETYLSIILSVLFLGYLYNKTGTLANTSAQMTYFPKILLRGFAEINLGIAAYSFVNHLKGCKFTKFGRILLTIFEIFGYAFVLIYAHNYAIIGKKFDYVVLALLFVSISISFSEKSFTYTNKKLKIFDYIGRYSLYPYLTYHAFVIALPVWVSNTSKLFWLYYVLTFSSALVLYLLEKPSLKLFSKMKKLIIAK